MSASKHDGLVITVAVIAGIALYAYWDSKTVIAWRLNVDSDNLTWAAKPHDCEFMTAPMGAKHCHYKLVEHKVLHSRNANDGTPIYSPDGGKTWERVTFQMTPEELAKDYPEHATIAVAWIEWEKVAD